MSGRRTDTRQRIQQVALELFAERGYDKTSLQEVADRLEITRPALYYHFKTKQEVLLSVVEDLNASIDDMIGWAKDQPRTHAGRVATLERIGALVTDQWRPLLSFAQVNQVAMAELPDDASMRGRMLEMLSVLVDPADSPMGQFQARLAVVALLFGNLPIVFGEGVTQQELTGIALDVATKLISD